MIEITTKPFHVPEVSFQYTMLATQATYQTLLTEVPTPDIENPEPYLVLPYVYEHRLLRAHSALIQRTFAHYTLTVPETKTEVFSKLLDAFSGVAVYFNQLDKQCYNIIVPLDSHPLSNEQYTTLITGELLELLNEAIYPHFRESILTAHSVGMLLESKLHFSHGTTMLNIDDPDFKEIEIEQETL